MALKSHLDRTYLGDDVTSAPVAPAAMSPDSNGNIPAAPALPVIVTAAPSTITSKHILLIGGLAVAAWFLLRKK